MSKISLALLAMLVFSTAARGETISELVNRGLVLLDSHVLDNGTVALILGSIDGGPQFICQTRYRISTDGDFDNCRMLK